MHLSHLYTAGPELVYSFRGLENKEYEVDTIFKSETLIYHSKANLDEKILFRKIIPYLDPEIRKFVVKSMLWNKNSTFFLVHNFIAIGI